MNFQDFVKTYDQKDNVLLLEGKRNVNDCDKEKLINLGIKLAKNTKYLTFRSGNATGADYFFSNGVCQVDNKRIEVIVPYRNHRSKTNLSGKTYNLEDIDLQNEQEIIIQSKLNKKMNKLIDNYLTGLKDRYSIKASYIIRDTIKVIGTSEIKSIAFAIFYDDLKNPMVGGTGHTMNICIKNNIPLINQNIWFNWLND